MASTPPPLPSSSEDDDFDDDDFGCFSSASVKPPTSNAGKDEGVKGNEFTGSNSTWTAETLKRSEESDDDDNDNRNVNGHSQSKEQLSAEIFGAHQFDEAAHTELESSGVDVTETSLNKSETSEDSLGSKDTEIDGGGDNSPFGEASFKEDHSSLDVGKIVVEASEVNVEISENETMSVANVVKSSCDNLSNDSDSQPNLVQNDASNNSQGSTNFPPEDISDEDDDFGNWSDMQAFPKDCKNSDDVVADSDMKEAQNESLNNVDVKDDGLETETKCDVASIEEDCDPISNSNPSLTPSPSPPHSDDIPDNPVQSDNDTVQELDDNQHSIPADNNNHGREDFGEDDGFGDFADFSSHQKIESDSDKEEESNVAPLTFSASESDDKEKTDEYKDDDRNGEGKIDLNNSTEKFDVNVESSNFGGGGDEDEEWGFKSADADTQGNKDDTAEKVDDKLRSTGDGNNDNGGDNDDWGFKSAGANGTDNNDDDDFGNFGSADTANDGSDWASFNETTTTPTTTTAVASDDVDDFDDFSDSDFQSPSVSQSNATVSVTVPKEQDSMNKLDRALLMCFPEVTPPVHQNVTTQNEVSCDNKTSDPSVHVKEIDTLGTVIEVGLHVTPKAKEGTWTITKELRDKDPVVGTWGRLKDVNSSHALDYGWNSSLCCQEVFSTLHIDTQNMLFSQKKQAVPFYSSGLGILEPMRGVPNTTTTEKSQSANNPPPTPVLLDTSGKMEDTKKVLDIPPVDFDWGSSGLTNPLKVFKHDSFNNGLTSLEPFSDVLHKNIEPVKELSKEAKSILSKIPNLNFMRSKVLMFPIKD